MRWIDGKLQIWPEDGLAWPDDLRPLRYETSDPEPAEAWYERNRGHVGHLHPLIASQWIHRHWHYSPYCSLPLLGLSWTLEEWTSERLLAVHCPRCMFDAAHDYQVFNTFPGNPTAEPMNKAGTWDIPVVLLHTPEGLIDAQGPEANARHLLVEGHLRMRYLNALVRRGDAASAHRVFVLNCGTSQTARK